MIRIVKLTLFALLACVTATRAQQLPQRQLTAGPIEPFEFNREGSASIGFAVPLSGLENPPARIIAHKTTVAGYNKTTFAILIDGFPVSLKAGTLYLDGRKSRVGKFHYMTGNFEPDGFTCVNCYTTQYERDITFHGEIRTNYKPTGPWMMTISFSPSELKKLAAVGEAAIRLGLPGNETHIPLPRELRIQFAELLTASSQSPR